MKTLENLDKKQLNKVYDLIEKITKILGCKSSSDFIIKCSQTDTTDLFHKQILDSHNLVVKELLKIYKNEENDKGLGSIN